MPSIRRCTMTPTYIEIEYLGPKGWVTVKVLRAGKTLAQIATSLSAVSTTATQDWRAVAIETGTARPHIRFENIEPQEVPEEAAK